MAGYSHGGGHHLHQRLHPQHLDRPQHTENVSLTTLFVTPACKSALTVPCFGTDVDPDIFKVLSAVGVLGTCSGIPFTVGAPDPTTGEVSLTPAAVVTLGPANGPVADRSCLVNLSIRVFQVPTNPVTPGSGTTDPLARGTLVGQSSGLNAAATGAQITISKATPGLETSADPTGSIVPGAA
jgi:hypothetical protein